MEGFTFYTFLIAFCLLQCVCTKLDDLENKDFISKSRAVSLFHYGGRIKERQRRSAEPRELGPNEIIDKPWNWLTLPNFRYFFKELREVKRFPGAWYGLPKKFHFDYMPPNNEFEKKIVTEGKGHLDLINMLLGAAIEQEWKNMPDDDFMTLYWRYGQCLRGKDRFRNCPDPCNNPATCGKVPKAVPERCRSVYDPSIKVDVNPRYKNLWAKIFQRRAKCACIDGYGYDEKTKTCIDVRNDCIDLTSGKKPCHNGGTCRESKNHKIGYECDCMPAYTGQSCQLPRNPCRGEHVCDRFRCKRDPANWKLGYTCLCNEKPGWERYSVEMPKCVDINECKMTPCINGGRCNNTLGSYVCQCPTGWVGKHCEHSNRLKPNWQEWGQYGTCSMTCGTEGKQTAYRKCNVPGMCVGTNARNRECTDVPRHCPKTAIFDDTFGLQKPRGANAGIYGARGGPINVNDFNIPRPKDEEPAIYNNSPEDVAKLEDQLDGMLVPASQKFPGSLKPGNKNPSPQKGANNAQGGKQTQNTGTPSTHHQTEVKILLGILFGLWLLTDMFGVDLYIIK